MLRKLDSLLGFEVQGKDEELGKVSDFYFDQDKFILRYLVIDTGNWLKHELTLVSTDAFGEIDFKNEKIIVDLSAEELENGPSIDKNKPISKIMEEKVVRHFEWPLYWASSNISGSPSIPAGTLKREKLFAYDNLTEEEKQLEEEKVESNLRSFREIKGYHIHAVDKEFGHLDDLFVDEEDWVIRYLLIDTRNILPGKHVLIAPEWISHISWNKEDIFVNKTKKEIKEAPEYREERSDYLVDRDYEKKLHDHYGEDIYWR